MQEIDWLNINNYKIDELKSFLKNGVSYEDMCQAGLLWDRRADLEAEAARIKKEKEEKAEKERQEEDFWQQTCRLNTIKSYEFYLDTYMPDGKYVFEAQMRINDLKKKQEENIVSLKNIKWKMLNML